MARVIAGVAALAVGLLAGFVVLYPGVRDFALDDDVYARRAVTDRVVTEGPDGRIVKQTTKEAGDSTLERALGDGGMLLVRMGVAVAAAFLTGAVVYRVLLGRYGFRAAATADLDEVRSGVAASTDALEALSLLVAEQGTKLTNALRTSADALRVASETARHVDELDTQADDPDTESDEAATA
jgi:hypothetical protein